MNGAPLPAKHGFPARLIVAGLYGYVSATKWLRDIVLTRLEDFDAYWVPRGWAKDGPIKTRVAHRRPRAGSVGRGWDRRRCRSGVGADAGDQTRSRCGSTTGAWQPARFGEVANDNTWVQWRYEWQASAGRHQLSVRATDGTGEVQTADTRPPAPDGATGYHSRTVSVA